MLYSAARFRNFRYTMSKVYNPSESESEGEKGPILRKLEQELRKVSIEYLQN